MFARTSPRDAYGKVDFEARVAGGGTGDLVLLCYERLGTALGAALHAARRGDNGGKSRALTRALSALTALELGVAPSEPLAPALSQIYRSARRVLLDCAVCFDAARVEMLRTDFAEIGRAMAQSARSGPI